MRLSGYFLDGEWAEMRQATAVREGSAENGFWVISEAESGAVMARWPATELVRKPGRYGTLRLSATSAPLGARFVIEGWPAIRLAEAEMPALKRQRHRQRVRQWGLLSASTALLAGVVALYVWGIPRAAGPITAALPLEWEADLGRSAAPQIEASLGDGERLVPCDPDPESPANQAISRFVARVLGDRTPPFPVRVLVGQSEIPNAFAIPGGQIYYLSSLLEETESGDEFAGVLAHEMGHVMHRHSMQNVISAAGTGLVIGFILGDMTGISVAGAIGSVIIDSHHSREAEREADAFSAEAANRLGFAPGAFTDLLDRIAEESSGDAIFALMSSHPLTAERRQNLDLLAADASVTTSAFAPDEWKAISTMCDIKSNKRLTGRRAEEPQS